MAEKKVSGKTSRSSANNGRRSNLRERQRELTREALLSGAEGAFAAAGYNDVTIDDIAMRAGTSRGTFYLYFTKGQILAELIERAFTKSIGGSSATALLPDFRSAEPYDVESIHRFLQSYVKAWQTNKSLVRAWMEGDAIDPEVQAITKKRISRATELLTKVILDHQTKSGAPADMDAVRDRAFLLDLQLQHFCWYVVVREIDICPEAGIHALAEQWHAVIHGLPADKRARTR